MNTLSSHINFNGTCKEAMDLYTETFGGKLEFAMTWRDSPMPDQVPADYQDKIMHCSLRVGNTTLMACDAPPERYRKAEGVQISITLPELEEATKAFETLASGGQTTMPFQETFWAKGFGMCTDRYGIPWMVNCENSTSI